MILEGFGGFAGKSLTGKRADILFETKLVGSERELDIFGAEGFIYPKIPGLKVTAPGGIAKQYNEGVTRFISGKSKTHLKLDIEKGFTKTAKIKLKDISIKGYEYDIGAFKKPFDIKELTSRKFKPSVTTQESLQQSFGQISGSFKSIKPMSVNIPKTSYRPLSISAFAGKGQYELTSGGLSPMQKMKINEIISPSLIYKPSISQKPFFSSAVLSGLKPAEKLREKQILFPAIKMKAEQIPFETFKQPQIQKFVQKQKFKFEFKYPEYPINITEQIGGYGFGGGYGIGGGFIIPSIKLGETKKGRISGERLLGRMPTWAATILGKTTAKPMKFETTGLAEIYPIQKKRKKRR